MVREIAQSASIPQRKGDRIELWRVVSDSWKKLTRQVENNLAKIGVGLPEFRILRVLEELGSSPMAQLSHETLLTQAAITAIVDDLEGRGFVKRLRSLEDRRVINVEITSKGKLLLKEAIGIHKHYVEEMLGELTDEELENFSTILGKLVFRVDSLAAKKSEKPAKEK